MTDDDVARVAEVVFVMTRHSCALAVEDCRKIAQQSSLASKHPDWFRELWEGALSAALRDASGFQGCAKSQAAASYL